MTAAARKPHKHAEVIKAWANDPAVEVQHRKLDHSSPQIREWHRAGTPGHALLWSEDWEYRIKPARIYPETRMALRSDLPEIYYPDTPAAPLSPHQIAIANAALRHAVDADQVVLKAEVLEVAREMSAKHARAVAEATLLACHAAALSASGAAAYAIRHSVDLDRIVAGVVG